MREEGKRFLPRISGGGGALQAHLVDADDVPRAEGDEGFVKSGGPGLPGHLREVLRADAQLRQGGGEAQGGKEVPGLLNGAFRQLPEGQGGVQAPDGGSVPGEAGLGFLIEHVAHPVRGQNGQAHAVGHVVEGRELMLHPVDAPGHGLAHVQKAVDGPGSVPHQVGPGLIVVRGLDGFGAVLDAGAEDGLRQALRQVVVLNGAEIVLEGVGHNVRRARGGLGGGEGIGVGGVQNGHGGVAAGPGEGLLLVGFRVGNDGDIVHLGAGGRHGQHGEDGQGPLRRQLLAGEVPGVPVVEGPGGHALGAVDNAAASQGQHAVQPLLPAEAHALPHRGDAGIGLHAGELGPLDIVGLQLRDGRVEDAVALDAAPAVDDQHPAGPGGNFRSQLFDLALAEVDHRGNGVGKVFHHALLSVFVRQPCSRLAAALASYRILSASRVKNSPFS